MLRTIAILFGIGLIFLGVAGFFHTFKQDALLFGYFEVNVIHNVLFIVTGVLAIMSATNHRYMRLFFQICGVFYAIVAIASFARNGDLYLMHLNVADNLLHVAISVIALYMGFFFSKVRV